MSTEQSKQAPNAQPVVEATQPGTVAHGMLAYITVGMWLTIIALAAIVGSGFATILSAFETNIPLNGLIIAILLTGLGRIMLSNVKLWRTARYMHRIDELVHGDEQPTDAHVEHLRATLGRQAWVLDTKQMADLLGNLTRHGHLNFTDNDARVIKSKVGFRVSNMRNNTGFLAGLLVMLGLLGTFWGLLATIDAVGNAMGGMSEIGGADASAMSGFLSAIAAPLDGMGLAFSSSLFGLSGSLLIGFFNFLAGGVHDRFIESVSRWIDERIPTPDQNMRKAQGNPKVAGSDELKAWLAGFVQTSLNTNRQIANLIQTMTEVMQASNAAARNSRQLLAGQRAMEEELKELRRAHTRGLAVVRKEVNDRSFELAARLKRAVQDDFITFTESLAQSPEDVERLAQNLSDNLTGAPNAVNAQMADTQTQLSSLVDDLQSLLEQQSITKELQHRATPDLDGLPPTLTKRSDASQPSQDNE